MSEQKFFSRPINVEALPRDGLDQKIEATPAEREAVAKLNGLEAIDELSASFTVKRSGRGVRVTGSVHAAVTQTCIVTLEPVPAILDEPVDVRFEPERDARAKGRAEPETVSMEDVDAPDPIVDGKIDLGALAAEFMVLGLDPYPRKPGAEFAPPADEEPKATPVHGAGRARGKARARIGSREPAESPKTLSRAGAKRLALTMIASREYRRTGAAIALSREDAIVSPQFKAKALEIGCGGIDSWMNSDIRIALDVMGGDHGPSVVVPAAAIALERRPDVSFLLFGDEKAIAPLLAAHPRLAAKATVVHCDVAIKMTDKPSQALRSGRRTSSMWRAIEAVKKGEADCAISAGNTGALMAMAKVCLHMLPLIDRPALAAMWPTLRGESIVLDVGATIGADAQHLIDLAIMGAAMARIVFDIERPTVGLSMSASRRSRASRR